MDGKLCKRHEDWRGGRDPSRCGPLSDSSMDGILDVCIREGTRLRGNLLAVGELSGNLCKCSGVLCGGALLCM